MSLTSFLDLSFRLAPLFLFVILGFFAGRKLNVTREAIAPLLIYILAPLTIFKGILDAELSPQLIMLPFLYVFVCALICWLTWKLGGFLFQSPARNVLSYAGGNANSGYFGFPAAIVILGADAFPIIVLISFGFVIFEATFGVYITARSHYSPMQSLRKLLRLPVLYVFASGLLLNFCGVRLSHPAFEFFVWIKGAFSVLGMMLLGIAMADVRSLKMIDWRFNFYAFFIKYGVWPAITFAMIFLDDFASLGLFSPLVRQVLILIALCPMAANVVAFASLLKAEPQKVAIATVISTLISILLIPLVLGH